MYKANKRLYISNSIRFDYSNTCNLKYTIQNLITPDIKENFNKALNNIQGDKYGTKGIHIKELTKVALAYFFSEVFPKNYHIKDSYYTLEAVKGFLDANNLSPYTAIHEICGAWFPLHDASLFNECWLIIQTAWFFNSEHFGHHQYIDYLNHYIETGKKLPIELYRYDKAYLQKKYKDQLKFNGFKLVEQWHYYILFLVVCELERPKIHFKSTYKGYRDYNPLTKCPRQLRPLTPFKVVECDIKSAFPSFLDYQFGCNLKDEVYNNLMRCYGIGRSDAKILFNKKLNSGKYLSKIEIIDFLVSCGYSEDVARDITILTHDPNNIFLYYMTEFEEAAIDDFVRENNIVGAGRLHDAVLFIDKGIKPFNLIIDNDITFGYKELNRPVIKPFFAYSSKHLQYARVSALPTNQSEFTKPLIKRYVLNKPNAIGEANGFKFYESKYDYITADFDCNKAYTYNMFIERLKTTISTLKYLNNRSITKQELIRILNNIRRNSNICFSVRHTSRFLVKYLNAPVQDIEIKSCDFTLTELKPFKTKIEFLNAYNEAKKQINQNRNLYKLAELLHTSYTNKRLSWLVCEFIGKHETTNKLERLLLGRLNYLITGYRRKPRQKNKLSCTLFNRVLYKEGASKLSKKEYKQLKDRAVRVKFWTHLLSVRFELEIVPKIKPNKQIGKQELNWLKKQVGEKEIKRLHLVNEDEVKPYTPNINDFCTDMSNSIFNQVNDEEAYYKGEQFWYEYQRFHEKQKTA